jgi:vitamin B12 transporter
VGPRVADGGASLRDDKFVNWRTNMPVPIIDTSQIVITASRAPESEAATPASVSLIDRKRIERLGEPLLYSILRFTPSAAIVTTGPAGSFTELRIRGSEANHSLLFIDGIRANDPAANDTPRLELLNADLASRIEVVRGPQSALWGSEAIGGVIAVNGVPDTAQPLSATAEAGSFGFVRASASATIASDRANLAGAVGWQRAEGIDSFGGGDRDGYRNFSGRLRGSWRPAAGFELGVAGFALTGRAQFDGFDPVTFLHADTLDSTRNRLLGGRIWAQYGSATTAWRARLGAALVGSSQRNFLDRDFLNRTRGERRTLDAQIERRFTLGAIANRLIVAGETEREEFHARDTVFGGFSNQDRTRSHRAMTVEWRGEAGALTGDVAVRRDIFNRFKDATTVKVALLANLGGGFAVTGSYGEGIAQPTFFDLFGFFPGTFVGNPALKPEHSRGFELSVRYRRRDFDASLTGYRQRLRDEIVDVFDPDTFLSSTVNRSARSKRDGVEAEIGWQLGERLRLSANYAFLDATEPGEIGAKPLRETRRPKHSGAIAVDGITGRLTYAASLAYSGAKPDVNFDVVPFRRVRLGAYWLLGARVAYNVRPGLSLFVRGSNLLDQRYQDAVGYRTEGRGLFAGVRLGG